MANTKVKSQILYEKLLKIVKPRLLSDMCGINDNGEFDIVLAIKEIIEEKEQECENLKKLLQNTEVQRKSKSILEFG